MIVRNYFVLGVEPGSVGLVPFLREVPKTTAVATTAMKSLLAGPPPIKGESAGPSTAIPEGDASPRPDRQERDRDREPLDRVRRRTVARSRCRTGWRRSSTR